MKKFSEVSVLYNDALIEKKDFIWYRCSPQPLSLKLYLRGNVPHCAWLVTATGKYSVNLALLRFADDTLIVDPHVFASCPTNAYAVLVLRFSHGQDAQIPVFIAEQSDLPREQKLFPTDSEDLSTFRFPNGESVGPFEPDGGLPITYDFTTKKFGNTARLKLGDPRPIVLPRARTLRMKLKGDGSCHRISVRFLNGYDATVYSSNAVQLNFTDVRTLEFEIPADAVLPLSLCDVIRIVYSSESVKQIGRLVLYELYASTDSPSTPASNSSELLPSASLTYFPAPERPIGTSKYLSETPSRILQAIAEDPAHAAIFSCATSEGSVRLFYRPYGSLAEFIAVEPVTEHGLETEDEHYVTVCYHKFYLYGLAPDTEYEYRIGNSRLAKFRTFPEAPSEFSAMFLEDVQLGDRPLFFERLAKIVETEAAEISYPAFVMTLGDIVHDDDSVLEYERVLAAGGDHFRNKPMAVTVGNHEYSDYHLFDIFTRRHAFPQGSQLGLGGATYSFTVGDYTFFAVALVSGDLYPQYLDDLDRALQACHSKWKIVFLHCSPYTGQGGFFKHRMVIAPSLERGGVDVVFSGHSHIYMRSSVWEDQAVAPEDGILYLTMGTAGHRMFANDRGFWQDYVYGAYDEERKDSDGMPDHTCAVAHFAPDGFTVSVHTLSGKTVDRIVIKK